MVWIMFDDMIQDHRPHGPFNDGPIDLDYRATVELFAQIGQCLCIAREQHHTAHRSIQAMDKS